MEHIGIHLNCWTDTYLSISTGFQGIFSLIFEGHPSNFRINSRAVIKKHAEDGVRSIFFLLPLDFVTWFGPDDFCSEINVTTHPLQ